LITVLNVCIYLLEEIVSMNNGSNFQWATDPEKRNHLWKARHDILYACMALRPGCKVTTKYIHVLQINHILLYPQFSFTVRVMQAIYSINFYKVSEIIKCIVLYV